MNPVAKKLTGLTLMASLAVAASSVMAADVGIGTNITTTPSADDGLYTLSLPIHLGDFTIEPELGYNRTNRHYPSFQTKNNDVALDMGLYWRLSHGSSLDTYIGGRVGMERQNVKTSNSSSVGTISTAYTDTRTYRVGPTVGAEYFFGKRFSVGLDLSVLYGKEHYENGSSSTAYASETDMTRIYTESRVKLRAYF